MSVLKFRLPSPDLASQYPELRKAYITGLDRTPARTKVELRPHLLTCRKEGSESGRVFVPWPVNGQGVPIVGTATLLERDQPYDLAVELARGKLNDVRNQLADWRQMGLKVDNELEQLAQEAQRLFARAVTSQDDHQEAFDAAQACLAVTWKLGERLVESYTQQVLQKRTSSGSKLPTLLACGLDGDPKHVSWSGKLTGAFNSFRVGVPWAKLSPEEGKYEWEEFDHHVLWCRKQKFTPLGGPLIEFRDQALPHWLWLWEGDAEAITGMVLDMVRQVLVRYRTKIPIWQAVHRLAGGEVLGLSEEEQIRLTAKVLQVARQVAPHTQFVIGFDRPWGESLGARTFQFGPLHTANSLAQAELGIAGIGLEFAPGYGPPGSHLHDLFEFSKLLDLFALINLPLHLTLVFPSSDKPDPHAEASASVEARQWASPPDETMQRDWASRWVSLAVAKPFVRTVTWMQAWDGQPHLYPHGGVLRPDKSPKPALDWIRGLRTEYLD